MKDKLLLIIFSIIILAIGVFFLRYQGLHYGGDIIEYYGTTQSLLDHATPGLTVQDKKQVERVLNPAYFTLPDYYLMGPSGLQYPVHFIFYSILLVPARLVLELFRQNPLNTFRITNLIIFAGAVIFIMRRFYTSAFKKAVFMLTMLLSPFIYFLIWPGPDVLYMALVLLAIYYFFEKRLLLATGLLGLASWQSQPLAFTAVCVLAYALWQETTILWQNKKFHITTSSKTIFVSVLIVIGILIPYLYNYLAFGVLTPWTALPDDWTRIFGFGLQNIRLGKFFEQFFDLDMGLFWYIPVLFIGGIYGAYLRLTADKKTGNEETPLYTSRLANTAQSVINRLEPMYRLSDVKIHKQTLFLIVLFLVTAFLYQTNPAWNYGTSGYGPTRHILYILPLFIYFFVSFAKPTRKFLALLILFVVAQAYVLSFNGFLTPNFLSSLAHTPYATYVLNNYPALYNPTPEIFIDRTNHTDLFLSSAIYKNNGNCTKAFVLPADVAMVTKVCGFFPNQYLSKLKDPLAQKSTHSRTVKTTEATFWPDAYTCDYPLKSKQYVCMFTLQDFMRYTGIKDPKRIKKMPGYKGVWQMTWGDPMKITIPPGYFIDYYSLSGIYVNF